MDFDWLRLLAAFGGGMFGAAVGGVPAFVLAGIAAAGTYGYAVVSGTQPDLGLAPLSDLSPFGPWLSPNIAFAGGVAAAAYAARRRLHASGNDTVTSLAGLNRPDVLLIGGIFGAYGYLIQWLCESFSPSYQGVVVLTPVVTAIVVSNVTSRLIFGNSGVFGKPEQGLSRWQATEQRNWVPWQEKPTQVLAIGLAMALPSAYLLSKVPALGFDLPLAISAVWLLFLCLGFKTPVAHHVTFGATIGVLLLGDFTWGLMLGLAAAFLGEIIACLVQYHGDTAIDPPSVTLLAIWILAVLSAPALNDISGWPAAAIGGAFALVMFGLLAALKKRAVPVPNNDPIHTHKPIAV
jgi:hypothetical protein